jgi:multidrug efflux pump subunit AcrA (membrane-fusion protein)
MARTVQARARLERVRYQLAQAQVRAPFAGVIVEGERKELIGLPMRQGDKLFRLARIEGLYAVILVSERDAHHLPEQATGRLRLLSQPEREIRFRVVQVVPSAPSSKTVSRTGGVRAWRASRRSRRASAGFSGSGLTA